MSALNVDAFRQSCSRLASGISILTCPGDEHPWGMTISSLSPVSIAPPTVTICVEKRSPLYEGILRHRRFAASILSAHQQEIGQRFADSRVSHQARFESISYRLLDGCPVVDGALSTMTFKLVKQVDLPDNAVFFGRVNLVHTQKLGEPLIYFKRHWRALA